MIWANTKYIGCGATYYEDSFKLPYQILLVCNYRPAGNIVGVQPYEKFEGTRCSSGVQSTVYPSLCAQDAKQAAGNYTVYCETFSSQSFRLHPAAILLFILLLTPL
ncbi:unnamed protein product [Nezara viridula]|uniref:SCP domain-containing protein n=1 Tax=Nezara viridula TaxID=85310 RepID=A0A9P0HSJ1_NEZVI|nr:unnamed protein product [Nezara viridula]